jgi:hypothetical protein
VTHPYQSLPPEAFWRTGVSEPNPLHIGGLWRPKFAITPRDRTVTAGSCFAQHISRAMRDNGFRWMNCERAPSLLREESAKRFNYGVFSFRTGNIYTTPLLRQWVRWALEEEPEDQEVWETDGRFYDPLRPQVEPGGFASRDELARARKVTIAAVRRAVTKGDVFVFTLGLTEGWVNTATGLAYATCPGTVGGEFDPDRHAFVNYSYPEVRAALAEVVELATAVNPDIRFLLTVSPVPLTATASGGHVLAATTYSKSVLRAVAGDLAHDYANVDYFPSFEIISSFPYRAMFYESNLRSVAPAGVAHVMEQFFAGLREVGVEVPGAGLRVAGADDDEAPEPEPVDPALAADEVVCEEELLDVYNVH